MPLQATSGAASYDGFGGGVAAVPTYIEEVFSTYLFTGNGTTQTVTNGIDLIGKGGMVWRKQRDATANHFLADTVRGTYSTLSSNTTAAASGSSYIDFLSDGFQAVNSGSSNPSGALQASWTFREQPKFFDIVTWTGDGTNRAIPHNLGSVPGCMIVKCTNAAYGWMVYHRSTGATKFLYLDTTEAAITNSTAWNDTEPTSTVFTVGNAPLGNESGKTYVAYLFAHDAGGFGLTGTDNVISCGSFTTSGTSDPNATVNLGYEPQWVMLKKTNSTGDWIMYDTMRGVVAFPRTASSQNRALYANLSSVEGGNGAMSITSTGFVTDTGASGDTYIYIAIRRGPMKTPTLGTSVFAPVARTGSGTNPTVVTTGNNPDLLMSFPRTESPASYGTVFFDKLRGVSQFLQSANTNAEATTAGTFCLQSFLNTGFQTGADFIEGYLNYSGATYAQYAMTRAPGFFDEVCFNGPTSGSTTQTHNLAVVPELMIVRPRSVGSYWYVYSASLGISKYLALNLNDAQATSSNFWVTAPTSTAFTCNVDNMGSSGANRPHVAYLFGTCAGVSKVGSYTGTGTTQTINCGFTAGARFVLIKRTDSTGDWYVWDSARGIVAGNDPYLLLNSTAAEVTGTDYVDTAATGFEISSTAPAAINASGGTFIFLAIA